LNTVLEPTKRRLITDVITGKLFVGEAAEPEELMDLDATVEEVER
jgi:hypothetical protein